MVKTLEKNSVKIRRLTSSDINSTLGIWWADIPDKALMASQLQSPLDLSFIAEYEGILIGFIFGKLEYAGYPTVGTGVVFLIAVSPDYQKQGVATMLLDTLEKYTKSKGIETVRVVISKNAVNNIEYFTKLGFKESDMKNYDKVCK